MKRLYLRIYLAVLASLAVLALVAGLTVYLLAQDSPPLRAIETAATLASNALPPAGAAHDVQQAALVKAWAGIAADVSLYAADGKRIASIGEPVALPQRLRGGPIHGWGKGGSWLLPLTDGRWLAVHMPQNHPPPGGRVLALLALLALAIGAGAYPVVRRLTRRIERLQAGVEALGAGALSARVPVEGNDEVALLAESFNHAAARIEALVGAHKTLLANASHELRTPLARIRMGLELLHSGGAHRQRELERDIAELDALIDEILLASRLDATHAAATREAFEDVDLLALAAEECARFEAVTLNGQAVTIRGDARLLRRLIRNLLENARRHGVPPVTVTITCTAGHAEIVVSDHGPGVPAHERERVFEPFYRRVGATEGGAGLGLALVRQIARRHGGDALVGSDGFHVTLAA